MEPSAPDEVLRCLGIASESASRLGRKAGEAEVVLGIRGVSVTAGPEERLHSWAYRAAVEAEFRVHDTPTHRDPQHRTIELPKPVTPAVAARFNRLFGRR